MKKEDHGRRAFPDLSKLLDGMVKDMAELRSSIMKVQAEVAGIEASFKKNDLLARVEKLEKGK